LSIAIFRSIFAKSYWFKTNDYHRDVLLLQLSDGRSREGDEIKEDGIKEVEVEVEEMNHMGVAGRREIRRT
jgi:hypothetical protein